MCVHVHVCCCVSLRMCPYLCTNAHVHFCMQLCTCENGRGRVCVSVCLCQEQIEGLGHMAATAGWPLPGIWVLRVNRIAGAQDCHPIKINVSSAHF